MSGASPRKFVRRKQGEERAEKPHQEPSQESLSELSEKMRLEFAQFSEAHKKVEDYFVALQHRWAETDIGKEITWLPRQVRFMLGELRKMRIGAFLQEDVQKEAERYEAARLRLEHLRYSTEGGRAYTDVEKRVRRSGEKMAILQEEIAHALTLIQINTARTRIRTLAEEILHVQEPLEVLEQYILQQEAERKRQKEAEQRQNGERGTIGDSWQRLGTAIRSMHADLVYKRQGIAVTDDELTRAARRLCDEYEKISKKWGNNYASEDVQNKYEEAYPRLWETFLALRDRSAGIKFDWNKRIDLQPHPRMIKIFRPNPPRKLGPVERDIEADVAEQEASSEFARQQAFEALAKHEVFNDLRLAQRESRHRWTPQEFMVQALRAVNELIDQGRVDEEFRGEFLRIIFHLQDEEFWNWSANRRGKASGTTQART